jgi:ribosomal subunit interface protein
MRVIYYLKNLTISKITADFLNKKLEQLNKLYGNEESLIEVELLKDKELKGKSGPYKAKFLVELPKRPLIVVQGVGKDIFQAINDGLKKVKRQLTKGS